MAEAVWALHGLGLVAGFRPGRRRWNAGKLGWWRRKLLGCKRTTERTEVFSLAKVMAKGNRRGRFGGPRRVTGALLLLSALAALSIACGGGNEGGSGGGGDAADRGSGGGGDGGGAAEGPPITELSEIVSASDRAELAGRRVRIPEVEVLEIVNNRSMFVGADEEERLFVAVRRTPRVGGTTGGIEEQEQQERQRFEEGQTLELAGVIRPVPETADEALRRFGLEGEQFELVQDEQVFIRANRAEVVGGG